MITSNQWKWFGALALSCALSAGAVAGGKSYFKENFSNYTDNAPNVTPGLTGVSVGNDPIWVNHSELNVRPPAENGTYKIFAKDIALPSLKAVDIQFIFRVMNAKMPVAEKKAVPEVKNAKGQVVKKAIPGVAAVPGQAKGFILRLNNKTDIVFMSDKVTACGKSASYRFIPNWTWTDCAVRVQNGKMEIYVAQDRKATKVLEVPFADAVQTVNFVSIPDNHFAFYNLDISDVGTIVDHPVQKHFASFASLKQGLPAGAVKTDVVIKPDAKGFAGVRLRLNKADVPLEMTLEWSNGKKTVHNIRATACDERLMAPVGSNPRGSAVKLEDAVIDLGNRAPIQYVRPHLQLFRSGYDCVPQYIDIVREWNSLPAASAHPFDLDFCCQADGSVQVYFDANFVNRWVLKERLNPPEKGKKADPKEVVPLAKLVSISFKGNGVAEVYAKKNRYAAADSKYYMLDFSANPRAKAFASAASSLKEGVQTIAGIPFDVAKPLDSGDIAICKQGMGNWALEVEEYHGRSPLGNLPSAVHFRVPAAPYSMAHIIFALDPDPAKDAYLTLRLSRYVYPGIGSNLIGDVVIDLRNGKIPSGFKQVGTITKNGKSIPLYKADIPLNLGKILDVAARQDFMDFEFTGKGWENFEQLDNTMKPDPKSDSAFNIFAATLEVAPVVMDFRQEADACGNIFTEEEDAKTTVTLKALRKANGTVSWIAKDVDGKEVFTGSGKFSFAKAGENTEIVIPLKGEVGYYDLEVTLSCDGCVPLKHQARFAILAKNNRKWSKEDSPYATWWFTCHGSPGGMEFGGPVMMKAGIRKSCVNPTPEATEKYGIICNGNCYAPGYRTGTYDEKTGIFTFNSMTLKEKDPKDPKKQIVKELNPDEAFCYHVNKSIGSRKFVDHIMVWHESAPGWGIPEELLNMPLSERALKLKESDKRTAAYLDAVGKMVRKHYPNLKIQIGNTSASIGAATRPLRAGADPKYIDQIGIETPSQVIMPEKLQECGFQGMVISKDIANYLAKGKSKIGLGGCWEFDYRCERDTGEQQQAEWYMRDILISLANNFRFISLGLLFDCSNGYYNGLWGGSGIITRAPYVYPKRAYVAYAALTSALDSLILDADNTKQLPTGSTTVYALEFKKTDGTYAYAFWSARGSFTLEIGNSGNSGFFSLFRKAPVLTGFFGKQTELRGEKLTIDGGTAPVYLNTVNPIDYVKIVKRSFPEDDVRAAKAKIASPFNDKALVTVKPDPIFTVNHTSFLPILKPGRFTVTNVNDPEKGKALCVSLDKTTDPYKSKYIVEYTTISLKEPKLVDSKKIGAVGVWIKGNSNWAQVRFEIEDAQGEIFKGLTTGGWGCDVYDWPGNTCINFDGWCFVSQPLFATPLFKNHSPGPASEQWISCGGDKKIDLPIKVRSVTIGIYRHKLDLTDFKESAPSVLVKDFGGVEE